jgi:zinc protease
VDQWDLAKSLAFYKARFSDASNFTFVFVGSFTPEMIKPLVETYVASLPATHKRETWRDVGITLPTGVVEKTIQKGIAPKSQVAIVLSGPFEYDDAHKMAFRTMALMLQSRLLETIRQELGGTYSITATPLTQKYPRPEFSIRIDWTCDPARTATLVQRVFDEIRFVRRTSLQAERMGLVREGLLREFERNSQDNGFVLNQLARRYEDGDPAGIAAGDNTVEQIAALTSDAIQQAAQRYLDTAHYVKVTLMPEAN